MFFIVIGELIKKDIKTYKNGNEYGVFSILDLENKEYEIISFKSSIEALKSLDKGSKIAIEGTIDSDPKTTSSGGRFINLKLIASKISPVDKPITSVDVLSVGNTDQIPF